MHPNTQKTNHNTMNHVLEQFCMLVMVVPLFARAFHTESFFLQGCTTLALAPQKALMYSK